jgi:hypothetical protein
VGQGDGSVARPLTILIAIVVVASACNRERAPAGITCDKLRSLRVGMPVGEVRRLVGSPLHEVKQDGRTVFGGPKRTDMSWDWRSESSGVRLYLYFAQGRLLAGESWIRTTWRDLFDKESRPILFTLKEDGTMNEGSDFSRIYCP